MQHSTSDIPRMADLIAAHDWASTPLGAIERWPQSLKTAVDIMLASGHAMQIAWGPERTVLYNDAYAPMLGERHPYALGLPFREAWLDIWEEIEPLVERVFAGGTVRFEDMPLVLTRHGYPEDTWWNFSYSPVRDEAGAVAGLLNVTADATPRVRAERAECERDEGRRLQSAMLEVLPVGLALIGPDGHVIMSNPEWDRFTPGGRLPSRDPTRGWRWRAWDSEGRPIEAGDFPGARALRGERCVPGIEFLYTDDSGAEVWTSVASVPLFDPHHKVAGAVSIIMDINAAKQAQEALRESEERQAFLLKLSDALRPLADAAEIQAVTTRLLGTHLGVDRAMYAEVEGELGAEAGTIRGQYVRPARGSDPSAVPFPDRFTFRPFGARTMPRRYRGELLVVADVEADPGFEPSERAAWAEANVRAAVVVPLAKGGRLVAEFGVHCTAPRAWTDAEVSLVRDVAERTWAAAERARAEAALRDTEERFRAMADTAPVLIWETDASGVTFVNRHYLDFFGVDFDAIGGMGWAQFLHPDDAAAYAAAYREAFSQRKAYAYECRFRRADGRYRWLRNSGRPVGEGRFVGCSLDVTDLQEAQFALHESRARLQAAIDLVGLSPYTWDPATGALEWDHRLRAMWGLPPDAHVDYEVWLSGIHPEDRARVEAAVARCTDPTGDGIYAIEYRVVGIQDRVERWISTQGRTTFENGRPVGLIGAALEITGRKRDEEALREGGERLKVLVAELQHRTRNLLGVLRSIADRTLASSSSFEAFRERFRDRIDALSRVNGLLSRLEEGHRISFDELIRAELAGLGVVDGEGQGSRVTLEGPKGVRLRSSTVQTFALGLHELATNAVKYGALSRPEGRLTVRWGLTDGDGETRLRMEWRENGVPIPPSAEGQPCRRGSGRELIERSLPYQLGAETLYELTPDGVRCTITLPISTTHREAEHA
ncbi:PAS domain S-box protein [Microvirga sp. M2]|uniref:PAS domain S-box protein n=1 Tax=Microvirga sp. M2 TaxID=3073270 RepID=UPI0039C361C8